MSVGTRAYRLQEVILIGGIKFGDLVLSIVMYNIQCHFLGESS